MGGIFYVRLVDQADEDVGYVNIYIKDRLYKQVSLGEPQTIVVERGDKYNEIRISPQSVVMIDANCHNKDCLHQGEITPDNKNFRALGNWIICLPNEVSIKVVRGEDE